MTGTGIKPAVRETIKKVNYFVFFYVTVQGALYCLLMFTCNYIVQSKLP